MGIGLVFRSDRPRRVRIQRVALVAPRAQLRDMLIHVASFGWVDLDQGPALDGADGAATPLPVPSRPLRGWSAFDAELERQAARAVDAGPAAALLGWVPAPFLDQLAAELVPAGGLVVMLASHGGSRPPRLRRRLTLDGLDGSDAPVPARPISTETPPSVSYLPGRHGLVAFVTGLVGRGRGRVRLVPGRHRDFRPWRLPPEDAQAPAGCTDRQAAS